jgi:hypothetical protein
MKKYFVLIIVLLFLLLSGLFYWLKSAFPEYSYGVLMTGNAVMAVLSILTYYMVKAQLGNKPAAFVRGVYASSFLKLLVCMGAILIYAVVNKANIHKPSLFSLFGIYAVYSVIETWMLSGLVREK